MDAVCPLGLLVRRHPRGHRRSSVEGGLYRPTCSTYSANLNISKHNKLFILLKHGKLFIGGYIWLQLFKLSRGNAGRVTEEQKQRIRLLCLFITFISDNREHQMCPGLCTCTCVYGSASLLILTAPGGAQTLTAF